MPRSSSTKSWSRWRLRRLTHRLPRGDPSRTSRVMRAYQADLNRRWAELNRVLRLMIIQDDILGLSDSPPRVVLQLQPPGRFTFPSDVAGKAEAFDTWLRGALDSELLSIVGGSPTGWQNQYVRASYSIGVKHADAALRAVGAVPLPGAIAQTFNQPIHVEKLRLLFSRNFNELKGITDATAQSLSRIVTEGLSTGQSPRVVARNITKAISTIGRNRSLVLARTETIRSHATATLARYEQSGIKTVQGFAEFLTAGDDRVCQTCQDLEGRRFSLDEAGSIIPVHPNCRCVWLPVLPDTPKTVARDPFVNAITGKKAFDHLSKTQPLLVDPSQIKSVMKYQNGGYRRLNNSLRTGSTGQLLAGDRILRENLDDVFDALPPVGKPLVVYRGSAGTPVKWSVGDDVIDAGFISTTTDVKEAALFMTESGVSDMTFFRIGVGEDTKAIWLFSAVEDGSEAELLLNRGTRFRVRRKRTLTRTEWAKENKLTGPIRDTFRFKEGTVTVYDMEIVPG